MFSSVNMHIREERYCSFVLRQTLSRVPMTWMMNRSFNSGRCCPFSSNNRPVLQRDWNVDCIMASDVLYLGKQQWKCCFLWPLCWGQKHERFWNKARSDRLQPIQRSAFALFCEWMHLPTLFLTVAGFVRKSGSLTMCGQKKETGWTSILKYL